MALVTPTFVTLSDGRQFAESVVKTSFSPTTSYTVTTDYWRVTPGKRAAVRVTYGGSNNYTSHELVVEVSRDGTNWISVPFTSGSLLFQVTFASGVASATAGDYRAPFDVPAGFLYARAWLKRTGGTTGTAVIYGCSGG